MQFINIVVHSVEDMNFRVHLQYDFTKLALDDYLEVWKLLKVLKYLLFTLTQKLTVVYCHWGVFLYTEAKAHWKW